MRALGEVCLLAAFVASGYSALAGAAAWRTGRRGLSRSSFVAGCSAVLALGVALGVLAHALVVKDFRFAYVVDYSSRDLPWHYSLSALWVGQAGSLLLWAWWVGVIAVAVGLRRHQSEHLRQPAFTVVMGYLGFLTATMVFAADPVAATHVPPADGAGLSPLLQHPAMLIHPPVVFLGYAAWTVPFALAIAGLARGELGAAWINLARPWALFAWMVLGTGILLGAQWSYEELGWGGYWAWDPVENGSLIPWLTGTAFLHTLMTWRNRGRLKRTALGLAVATFALCNFSTFLTRSGIFSSLHAFSQSPIGWLFLVLMIAVSTGAAALLVRRWGSLRPENPLGSLGSRDAMIVVSLVALLLLAAAAWIGTLFVALSDAVVGRRIILGAGFYNVVLIPTGLLLMVTLAPAPLLGWGRAPTPRERRAIAFAVVVGALGAIAAWFASVRHPLALAVAGIAGLAVAALAAALAIDMRHGRQLSLWLRFLTALTKRRRLYAGFLVHMGFVALAVGVAGSSLGTHHREAVLSEGESLDWAGRSIRFARLNERPSLDKRIVEAELLIRDSDGTYTLRPAQHLHHLQNDWTTEVAIHSTWGGDFYTILHNGQGSQARFTFVVNPLMRWLWLGGAVMAIGALLALWPEKRKTARDASPAAAVPHVKARRRKVAKKKRSLAELTETHAC